MQSRMQCLSFIDAACAGAGVRRPVIEGMPFNWISNDRIVSVAFAIARERRDVFRRRARETLHAIISTTISFFWDAKTVYNGEFLLLTPAYFLAGSTNEKKIIKKSTDKPRLNELIFILTF